MARRGRHGQYKVKKSKLPRTIKGRSARIVEWNVVLTRLYASEATQIEFGSYDVPIGEALEVLAVKAEPVPNQQSTEIRNLNQREWNSYITNDGINRNTLPFGKPYLFPRRYTLKMSEGDRIRIFVTPTAGSNFGTATGFYTAVVRRYKSGSGVDYKNFDDFDGGLNSLAHYWEQNVFDVADTTTNTWSNAMLLDIVKNEAYYIMSAGVTPTANLNTSRIFIDDQIVFNEYTTRTTANELPFVDTNYIDTTFDPTLTAITAQNVNVEHMHRFNPVLKAVKNRNKNVRVQFLDSGTAAVDALTRWFGVKRIIA